MATITPTSAYSGGYLVWTWSGAATGDTIVSANIIGNYSDLLLYVSGTFGSATASLTGSIDDTNYQADLVDVGGTAIAITAAGGAAVRDAWPYIKPAIAGGTGDSLTIQLAGRIVK